MKAARVSLPVTEERRMERDGERLTVLDYVFVDEHNRHKRLKGSFTDAEPDENTKTDSFKQ